MSDSRWNLTTFHCPLTSYLTSMDSSSHGDFTSLRSFNWRPSQRSYRNVISLYSSMFLTYALSPSKTFLMHNFLWGKKKYKFFHVLFCSFGHFPGFVFRTVSASSSCMADRAVSSSGKLSKFDLYLSPFKLLDLGQFPTATPVYNPDFSYFVDL